VCFRVLGVLVLVLGKEKEQTLANPSFVYAGTSNNKSIIKWRKNKI
jgi:hypothetical protein